jgi:4-hydroxythreonine-4-phosphate dehydrogenase
MKSSPKSTNILHSSATNQKLCLTIGDPGGIGPEIVAKYLQADSIQPAPQKLIIIGHIESLEKEVNALNLSLDSLSETYEFIHIQGNPIKESGTIVFQALNKAVELMHQKKASGLVTGPISKEKLHQSGIHFSGHTEILEHLARQQYKNNAYQSDMLFLYRGFRMLLLTRHVPLQKVSESLTEKGVHQSLTNLIDYLLNREKITLPQIAMMGVNPHAMEIGGTEERMVLIPALEKLNAKHPVQITLPLPADALFRSFHLDNIPYHAYVATYHDQGLIPFKLVAGYQAVNVTIGLPFIRTSVSHGTAPDIVGQGIARYDSLEAAVQTAQKLI